MVARAIWKGDLRLDELSCPIALHAAATTASRISFHIVDRRSGNRVRREYVDEETGEPVERDQQVKGYETSRGQFVILEPEEIASAVPQGDKTLAMERFIACDEVDTAYFDKPYFVTPAEEAAVPAFAVLREGMRARKVAGLARAVLFRRVRTVLLRPHGAGMLANTLNFNHEVVPAEKAFASVPEVKIEREMLALARHIIDSKRGSFDPAAFDDRYDDALAELVRAKAEGRPIPRPPKRAQGKVVSLLDALRESAKATERAKRPQSDRTRRKAG